MQNWSRKLKLVISINIIHSAPITIKRFNLADAIWNPKLFWHTLFSQFSFGSASDIIEFTLLAPFNFTFLLILQKPQ